MKKVIFTLFIIILIGIFYLLYLFLKEGYAYNGMYNLKLERVGNNLNVTGTYMVPLYQSTRVEYKIKGNNIYIWYFVQFYKLVKNDFPKIKIPLEDKKYNIYYLNPDGTTIFIEEI